MKIAPFYVLACLTALPVAAMDDLAKKHATDFAMKAALNNMFEIEAAKIEITKGKAEGAKQFAQDMAKDHGRMASLLEAAAREDGVALPAALDDEHKQKITALQQSDPSNMDQAYLSTQVTAHQQAVELFQRFSKEGPDGQLKRTAGKVLPELIMHLTRVEALTSK